MAYPLTSPGVDITVTDESFYSSGGTGTVPLFIIGTHEYKVHPSGTGIAQGTLPSNANKLYTITSQRDLIQTFGNPIFYTSNGSPLHGYETNEYGLHAAYQYLGINSSAYVIRGALDYTQLIPSTSSPRGEAVNGTYWFDTNLTSFGVFVSNGNSVPGLAWQNRNVTVIDTSTEVDNIIIGSNGFVDPTTDIVSATSSTLVINGVTVSNGANSTLSTIVNNINNENIPNVTAVAFRLAGTSRILLRNSLGTDLEIGNTSTPSLLTSLGLTSPGNAFINPKATIGLDGDFAIVALQNDNVLYQKLKAEGIGTSNDVLSTSYWFRVNSSQWKAATPTRVVGSATPGSISTSDTITISADGGTTVMTIPMTGIASVSDLVSTINTEVGALTSGDANKVIFASGGGDTISGNYPGIIITNVSGGSVSIGGSSTLLTTLGLVNGTTKGNELFYSQHYNIPSNSVVGDVWVKTTEFNSGAKWIIKNYNSSTSTWNIIGAPLYLNDTVANSTLSANKSIGTLYVRYNVYSGTSDEIGSFQIRRWNGITWEELIYEAGSSEPTTLPEEGTYWYNQNFRVDIMVCDGTKWVGYQNYAGNSATDPNGVIISGSAPVQQSDGTPLVQNDIWLDSSDTENYPKLYRFNQSENNWEIIDNTDQTTPFGILFADARWNSDGELNGSEEISDMLVSDFVDPDAPEPRIYPNGMLLFNTRYSFGNVKEWRPGYFFGEFGNTDYTVDTYNIGLANFSPLSSDNAGRWVTVSGNQNDGSPYMLRKAQRQMIVKALASTISGNDNIRSDIISFNIMSAPGYPELIDEMVVLNQDRKETAFIVGDTPARLQPDGTSIQEWASGTNAISNGEDGLVSSYAYLGVYYPWGLSTNIDGSEVMVPPSTMAIRTIAYSDNVSYPWFAPAGYQRGLVSNATSVGYLTSEGEYQAVYLNAGQKDILYTNNINPIAFMPNRGLTVYGQKTRYGSSSALDRINVVRLLNYLRVQLDNASQPFIFQNNTTNTRDGIRTVFERIMGDLVSLEGLYDFIVVCDDSNNTPERIDRNELWVDVAIQPVKTVEFIYVPIRVVNTGDDLSLIYEPRQNQ